MFGRIRDRSHINLQLSGWRARGDTIMEGLEGATAVVFGYQDVEFALFGCF